MTENGKPASGAPAVSSGIRYCGRCGHKTEVIRSWKNHHGFARRRRCPRCDAAYTTIELLYDPRAGLEKTALGLGRALGLFPARRRCRR